MYEYRCDESKDDQENQLFIMNQELKTRPIYECRYDERLKTKPEKSTRLGYT
jgi:hypothetical protein